MRRCAMCVLERKNGWHCEACDVLVCNACKAKAEGAGTLDAQHGTVDTPELPVPAAQAQAPPGQEDEAAHPGLTTIPEDMSVVGSTPAQQCISQVELDALPSTVASKPPQQRCTSTTAPLC